MWHVSNLCKFKWIFLNIGADNAYGVAIFANCRNFQCLVWVIVVLSLWKIAHVCCKLRNFLWIYKCMCSFPLLGDFFLHIGQRTLTILSLLMGLFRYQTQQENSKTTFLVKTMFCTMNFLSFCSICWHSTIPKPFV
jgi:hypothetical protein